MYLYNKKGTNSNSNSVNSNSNIFDNAPYFDGLRIESEQRINLCQLAENSQITIVIANCRAKQLYSRLLCHADAIARHDLFIFLSDPDKIVRP